MVISQERRGFVISTKEAFIDAKEISRIAIYKVRAGKGRI